MVKVNVLRAPKTMEFGEKALLKPGRFVTTVRPALAGPLLPALDVKSPDTFICVPGVLLVTSTVIEHILLPATTPAVKVIVPPPSGAVRVPPHVELALAGVAIVTPAGKVSVNASRVAGDAAPLMISKVRVLTLPGPIVVGPKDFEKDGGDWAYTGEASPNNR
jgi:hypothetical protein